MFRVFTTPLHLFGASGSHGKRASLGGSRRGSKQETSQSSAAAALSSAFRRSSSTSSSSSKDSKKSVSFASKHLNRVHPAPEYDREGYKTETLSVEEIKTLVEYCEREMKVHSKSKETVKHLYLHGRANKIQNDVRVRCILLNANNKIRRRSSATPTVPMVISASPRLI